MRNKKARLITTLSVAIAIAHLSGCGKTLSYDEYMVAAKTQIEQGDASSAILSLKNAVRLKPKDVNSRYQLGVLYLNEGDLFSAEKELEKAVELGAEQPLLLPSLAKVKMLLSKYDETYALADNPAEYDNEEYVMILTYAGLAAISDNKIDVATDYIGQASMLSEESLYSRVGSAWLNFSNEKYTEVSETLEAILSQSDKFSDALLLSGHLHQAQLKYQEAIKMYSAYLEQHPRQFQVKLYLINSLLSAKEYERAESELTVLNKLYQDHPIVNLYNAQIQYNKEAFVEAKKYAENAVSAQNSLYMGQLIAGMSAFRLGELELAYTYLSRVGPLLPANHEVKKLLAVLQLQLGFDDEAQLSFEGMTADDIDDSNILNAASRAFADKGNHAVAENLLGKVVKANPDNSSLALQYSALKLANGDETQLSILEDVMKNEEESDAPMILATYYINVKDYDNAFRVAKDWQQTEFGKVKGQLLEGFIFVSQEKIESAKAIFNQILASDNTNIPANYYLGEFAFNNKEWEKSKAYYLEILASEPMHKASVARLSYVNTQLNKTDETIEYLEGLLAKFPNNQEVMVDLAINLNTVGKTAEAIKLLESAGTDNKSVRYVRSLARLYVSNNQLLKAKELYETLSGMDKSNEDVWLEKVALEEKLGNLELALTVSNDALRYMVKREKMLLVKANLLLTLKRYDSASEIINTLFKKYPTNKDVIYLKAQLNLQQNNIDEAQTQYALLYKANPSNELALRWAQTAVKHDNLPKAIAIIEDHGKVQPLSSANKMLLAELLLTSNPSKAKGLYVEVNKAHPNNVAVLNNLAWAHYNLEEFDKALMHAEQAYNLVKSSTTLDTYAMSLIASNKERDAIELIVKNENKPLLNENLRLTLVESYISLKEMAKAKETLNEFQSISEELRARYNKLSNQL